MASLLQVCLALLLVSCVHGQAPVFLNRLVGQCKDGAFGSRVLNCSLAFSRSLGISETANVSTNAICNNIPAVVTVNSCFRSTFETCLSSEYHGLFKADADARDQFQYFCDHRKEINSVCVNTALLSDSCAVNAGQTYAAAINQIGLVPATCNYMETLRGCIYNSGASCPNHNRDFYDTYWAKSYPPACTGGASRISTSFLLLGACAVLLNKMAAAFLF